MTIIMEGKTLAKRIIESVKREITDKKLTLKLAIVIIGNDPASKIYVSHKLKVCKEIGIKGQLISLTEKTSLTELKKLILDLNNDKTLTGFILQLPFPQHLVKQQEEILNLIDPKKDVDGLSGANNSLRINRTGGIVPATPFGIFELFKYYNFDWTNKYVALLGQGVVVGKPMAVELDLLGIKHICLDKETDLEITKKALKEADIIVSSTGVKHILNNKNQVKEKVILIDVGISKRESKKIYGDVNLESFLGHASAITPVPGGIGPMTVASLIQNLLLLNNLKK